MMYGKVFLGEGGRWDDLREKGRLWFNSSYSLGYYLSVTNITPFAASFSSQNNT